MAKKKLDLQSILDNPEQLADLQNKAMHKRITDKRMATFAADPDIVKKMVTKRLATLAADPEIRKRQRAKLLATIAADPDIKKKQIAKAMATKAANPDIEKKRVDKLKATWAADPDIIKRRNEKYAKKQELYTPYGKFTFRAEAARALVGQIGLTGNWETVSTKISDLIRTNPKEWYWVKKS